MSNFINRMQLLQEMQSARSLPCMNFSGRSGSRINGREREIRSASPT